MSRSYGPVRITSKLIIKFEFSFTRRIVRQFSKIYVLEFSHLFSVIICDITTLHRTGENWKFRSLFRRQKLKYHHSVYWLTDCIHCWTIIFVQFWLGGKCWRDVHSTLDNLPRNLLNLLSSFTPLTLLTRHKESGSVRCSQGYSATVTVLQYSSWR